MAYRPNTARFELRCDGEWLAATRAAADDAGESVAAYLRRLATADIEGRPAPTRAQLEALDPAIHRLQRAGRNLNRLVMLLEIARRNPAAGAAALANDPEGSLATAIRAVEEAASVLKARVERL